MKSFAEVVRDKARRRARARAEGESLWRHLVHVGVLGWTFVLPVVLGAVLGRALAHWTGVRQLALVPLLLGVVVGAYAVWRQVRSSVVDEREDEA